MSYPERNVNQGVYPISVAATLVGTRVQNLRAYERRGLCAPTRSAGGTRRYSDNDIARLRRVTELLAAGLNLTGIGYVLQLEARVRQLDGTVQRLREDNQRLRDAASTV